MGVGFYNSRSQIVWRRVARTPVEISRAFLHARLAKAIERRKNQPARRLVWAEADGLPGLVVDQFGLCLAVQFNSLGLARLAEDVVAALQDLVRPEQIAFRNDSPARAKEGLPRECRMAVGSSEPFWCQIGSVEFLIDPLGGQKTGAYLDQQDEYGWISQVARGRRVLDLFCHHGGFALHAAAGGAAEVTAVDSSGPALAQGQSSAERAGLLVRWVEQDVSAWMRTHRSERFDLIILDPPPLGKSHASLGSALEAYRLLNQQAVRLLSPGGILATYTCSQRVSWEHLTELVSGLCRDLNRDLRLIRRVMQPADHPILANFPESEYLRGAILEVLP